MRSLLCLCVALAVLAPTALSIRDGGYFCRGCAVVVEEAQKHLMAQTSVIARDLAGGSTNSVSFDVPDILKNLCRGGAFGAYSDTLRDQCTKLVGNNADVAATVFAGDSPTPANTFSRTTEFCENMGELCPTEEERRDISSVSAPGSLPEDTSSDCSACLAVVRDISDVLIRQKGRKDYLSKKHVWSVLDDECVDIPMRHPARAAREYGEVCSQLVEEFDSEMAGVFLSPSKLPDAPSLICSKLAEMCTAEQASGSAPRSPFSFLPLEYFDQDDDEL